MSVALLITAHLQLQACEALLLVVRSLERHFEKHSIKLDSTPTLVDRSPTSSAQEDNVRSVLQEAEDPSYWFSASKDGNRESHYRGKLSAPAETCGDCKLHRPRMNFLCISCMHSVAFRSPNLEACAHSAGECRAFTCWQAHSPSIRFWEASVLSACLQCRPCVWINTGGRNQQAEFTGK